MIDRADMLRQARGLLDGGLEDTHPEYVRALCELIARCYPGTGCDTPTTAKAVRAQLVPSQAPYYVWVDGDCTDKADALGAAISWAFQFQGRDDVYVADANNDVIYRP